MKNIHNSGIGNTAMAKCKHCWKPPELCVCSAICPMGIGIDLLILQHPSEARNPLNTARLLSLGIENSTHRIGLSWPSLKSALGRATDAKKWAVLYLGTRRSSSNTQTHFEIIHRDGKRFPLDGLLGLLLIDGNWKQSKSLWWRNSWLLKLPRVVLNPTQPSQYQVIRREPRNNCRSTIEAAAETLSWIGEEEASKRMTDLLEIFIEKAKMVLSD